MTHKFMTADQAARLIPDGATLGLVGGGGGLLEADALLEAVEQRFLQGQGPHGLRVVHSLGIGDRDRRGLNRLAYPGLVQKVIGGHWVWSPRMQQLASDEQIEAYVLPAGVLAQLLREIAAGRPGLITHVGLGTFVDPTQEGGRMNRSARDLLVERIELGGQQYLRYLPFRLDVALLRGSAADAWGNISLEEEAANLETFAMAQAVHNCGGKVIVQVRQRVEAGQLTARQVRIPAPLVDAVVVVPDQPQSHRFAYDPTVSGQQPFWGSADPPAADLLRQIIGRRAARQLRPGMVVNYGFGIPDAVAAEVHRQGQAGQYYQTIEHGTYGGQLLQGELFGFARGPSCIIDSPSQFDFYSGGGLDIAFLGFGEMDAQGNVNVSRLAGRTVGPGGFMDIAQNARQVVFCGSFDTRGSQISWQNGALRIDRPGQIAKLVARVEQITFSGPQALQRGQQVWYITERAVFELTAQGVVLREVAPGVRLEEDLLARMGFQPVLPERVGQMLRECFEE